MNIYIYIYKYHSIARSNYLIWRSVNNPRYGIVYDNMVMSRRKFKYELRTSKAYYSRIESNDVSFKLINDRNSFWKIVSSKLKKTYQYKIILIMYMAYLIL